MFYKSIFIKTNRTSLDLSETEAELAAGYNAECYAVRVALFFWRTCRYDFNMWFNNNSILSAMDSFI